MPTREDHLAAFETEVASLKARMKDALSYLGRSSRIMFALGGLEVAESFLRLEQGKTASPADPELFNTERLWPPNQS